MKSDRYDVTRTNGHEVELVRDLPFGTARRIVERDEATGTRSTMEVRSRVRASGRLVLR